MLTIFTMHEVAFDLLILLAGIWVVAITLRPLGLPTVMGDLIVGVLLGPAVFGLIEPGEAIRLLAEIGIFFLMFHAGVETQPVEFYDALKRSLGVAVVGAVVPFGVSFGVAWLFGLDIVGATFVGLTMTATAVVITLTSLKDLDLANTRLARVIVASCVIDDMLTLVFFGLVIGLLSGGTFEPLSIIITLVKVVGFFTVSVLLGRFVYPRLTLPFRSEGGKGFTFVLLAAIAAGLFAEAIGLHMILGAYIAGLFFEEKVAHPNLVRIVKDRAYGIAYSFLGPIFFMSLGFSITFDISAAGVAFIAMLTTAVIVGQILSAGGMALRIGLPPREALTVGVGMCGRAEMAFILAALALAQGAFDQVIFTAIILTAFILNLFTPLALKGCAVMLQGKAAWQADATSGIIQLDKFDTALVEERDQGQLLHALPDVEDAVVIYGYGPEVESLMRELESRGLPRVVIEEDETVARRLQARGERVVHASLSDEDIDLKPLAKARAVVANGEDENNALLAMSVRELGFGGPIIALIDNPNRRAPMQLAGATAAFTPNHVLAAVVAVRASARIGPRITGVQPLGQLLEVAEVRIHDKSPLANKTIAESVLAKTGAHIVAQWVDDALHSPPDIDQLLQPGMLLVAAGSPDSIKRLSEIARPITQEGTIVVVGYGDVGRKLVEMLKDAGEEVCVVDEKEQPGVDVAGDVLDTNVLEHAGVATARVVIFACENDSVTLLAVTVARNYAPDVPIIACASVEENVGRIQQAGADSAFSVSQVAGQLLAHYVLDKMVSQQGRIKLFKLDAGRRLAGNHPLKSGIRERTGCTVIAVERAGKVIMNIPPSFILSEEDALYICGTVNAFNRFYEKFADSQV
jgi:Kef-type K+ transport system membrane component KefB/Trk K+ transport system NAD-binding subunit